MFKIEEPSFPRLASEEPAQRVFGEHTVAGEAEGQRVVGAPNPNGPGGSGQQAGEFPIRNGMTLRNCAKKGSESGDPFVFWGSCRSCVEEGQSFLEQSGTDPMEGKIPGGRKLDPNQAPA